SFARPAHAPDLLRALPVDLEQHGVASVAELVDVFGAGAVPVVEYLRMLEERPSPHELPELRLVHEKIVATVTFGLAPLARRVRDRESEAWVALEQFAYERCLAGARWCRNDPEVPARRRDFVLGGLFRVRLVRRDFRGRALRRAQQRAARPGDALLRGALL